MSNANRNIYVKVGREAEKGHPVPPRVPKPDGPATKRKRPNNAASTAGFSTFSPSPLGPSDFIPSPYSTLMTVSPYSTVTNSPSSTNNNNEIEMTDAVTNKPVNVGATDETKKIKKQDKAKKDKTNIKIEPEVEVKPEEIVQDYFIVSKEVSNGNSITMSKSATTTPPSGQSTIFAAAATAAANTNLDIEAAHMLLGFRAA